MSAVEELAQAILDGRMWLDVRPQGNEEVFIDVVIKPKEEDKPA